MNFRSHPSSFSFGNTALLTLAAFGLLGAGVVLADRPAVAGSGESVLVDGDSEKYLLRHQLAPNQTVRYKVTHVAKTKTRMNGTEEVANVHTTSVRSWKVRNADENEMTFDHQIDSVEMTQQNGDQAEVRWDSTNDKEPPKVFSVVAEQIGTPLATVTIDGKGEEIKRESHAGSKSSLGMGSLTLALPAEPVAIGESWSVPSEIQARTDDGLVKTIKIRQVYTLKKVKAGVATISVKSQTLTPIDQESLRAQVVQQLSNGSIRFDVDNGYLLGKELDWDETVVGFQGPGSMMEYRARMTEELVDATAVKSAAKPNRSRR
ncbi:DUF6263 family protein [Rhodopirellula sallentina]|uniref:Putative secreted protein n=1 Tax=Rhodopirellula sallentina SM41 TaxID=1263870 RepID=M5U020_9BACT|nr:DUF6263 family protein [Rhodopirellula sallentina]EMI54634.1 putative secreted protein [Rhodopirellula sallentina SM41]